MRMGTSQRACVIEAEQRTRKLAPLRASIKSTVDSGPAPVSAPVPARVPASISSPAAGPALGPASVPFVTPLSLLLTNAVSTSSPIGSLPSLTCSDLAAKHAKFECDHLLPASSILPADTALPSSPHASSMPSSMPNASDTDILIKLVTFKDALACHRLRHLMRLLRCSPCLNCLALLNQLASRPMRNIELALSPS
jgi:hypothetical protein